MSAFTEDLKRWKDRSRRPIGAEPSPLRLTAGDVIRLLWRHPAVWAVAIHRLGSWCHRHRIRLLPALLERMNLVLFGLEVGPSVPIGPGFYLPHPSGTVIQAWRIGANGTVIHAATLGLRKEWRFPTLGDGVFVGAGARILGGIELGDNCTIGANAVVIEDVPAGATVVGVPARLVSGATGLAAMGSGGGS